MHIWDTFCITLHLDGLQRDFYFWQTLEIPCRGNVGSFAPIHHSEEFEIHKVFLHSSLLAL